MSVFEIFLLFCKENRKNPIRKSMLMTETGRLVRVVTGLEYAKSSVITFEPCALQENTLNLNCKSQLQKNSTSYSSLSAISIIILATPDLAKCMSWIRMEPYF